MIPKADKQDTARYASLTLRCIATSIDPGDTCSMFTAKALEMSMMACFSPTDRADRRRTYHLIADMVRAGRLSSEPLCEALDEAFESGARHPGEHFLRKLAELDPGFALESNVSPFPRLFAG